MKHMPTRGMASKLIALCLMAFLVDSALGSDCYSSVKGFPRILNYSYSSTGTTDPANVLEMRYCYPYFAILYERYIDSTNMQVWARLIDVSTGEEQVTWFRNDNKD